MNCIFCLANLNKPYCRPCKTEHHNEFVIIKGSKLEIWLLLHTSETIIFELHSEGKRICHFNSLFWVFPNNVNQVIKKLTKMAIFK